MIPNVPEKKSKYKRVLSISSNYKNMIPSSKEESYVIKLREKDPNFSININFSSTIKSLKYFIYLFYFLSIS